MNGFDKIWKNLLAQLQTFLGLVKDVWENGVLGQSLSDWLVAMVIFLFFLFSRKIVRRMILRRVAKAAKKSKNKVDDKLIQALKDPLEFIPVILGLFFALEYLAFDQAMAMFLAKIVKSLIIFDIFWALYNMVVPFSGTLKRLERLFTSAMIDWLIKAIRFGLLFIGFAAILDTWGVKIGPVLAGLGLFGVAVALGAQDMFKNLISGLLILAEKRFLPGDWVKVEGVVEGTVETIGFRSTMIRRFDKAPVYVPNAKLADTAVINFSQMTHRRIVWVIGIEYSASVEQLKTIRDRIEEYILNSEEFAKPPQVPTFVRIDKFNDSSIDIMLYCFTNTTVWAEWLKIKEQLAYRIKDIVEDAGSGFAFPSQSVYVESMPSDKPDLFVPPEEKG